MSRFITLTQYDFITRKSFKTNVAVNHLVKFVPNQDRNEEGTTFVSLVSGTCVVLETVDEIFELIRKA